jgi:RNA-directed DNA polymerase
MSERPVHSRSRRLADWLNPAAARKVHSLVDKVYQRKNLQMAWERVKANRGSGGVDLAEPGGVRCARRSAVGLAAARTL